ncbi:hypothetical protein EJB05_21890, partial [Eragrostis curvula]
MEQCGVTESALYAAYSPSPHQYQKAGHAFLTKGMGRSRTLGAFNPANEEVLVAEHVGNGFVENGERVKPTRVDLTYVELMQTPVRKVIMLNKVTGPSPMNICQGPPGVSERKQMEMEQPEQPLVEKGVD